MKKKIVISIILVVAIAFALIVGGAYAIKKYNQNALNPTQTVSSFYENWTEYDGNPIVDRFYQKSEYVTTEFVSKTDRLINSFQGGGYDPVLCAQDKPESIQAVDEFIDGKNAKITIQETFSGVNKSIEVHLVREDNLWKIDEIKCINNDEADNSLSDTDKTIVGDYIRENISSLSPQKEVLGGKFYITEIRFIGSDSAIVRYEDGHVALEAQAVFQIAGGKIQMKSFVNIGHDQNN